jgi:hypothetical protein
VSVWTSLPQKVATLGKLEGAKKNSQQHNSNAENIRIKPSRSLRSKKGNFFLTTAT